MPSKVGDGPRLTLRSVLLIVMDDVDGPIIAGQHPPTMTNAAGVDTGLPFIQKEGFFDHFQPFMIPKTELTKRIQWLLVPNANILLLYYPEEIKGKCYDRFLMRFSTAFAFETCDNFSFLRPSAIAKALDPHIVALRSITEELREVETRYGYVAWALNEKRLRMLAGNGGGGVGGGVTSASNGGGAVASMGDAFASLRLDSHTAAASATAGGHSVRTTSYHTVPSTMTTTFVAGAGASSSVISSGFAAAGPEHHGNTYSHHHGAPPPVAATTTRVRDASAVAKASSATEEDGTPIAWTPLPALLRMIYECLLGNSSVVAVSTTTHQFHIKHVPRNQSATALSIRHIPFPIATLQSWDVTDVVLADVYAQIDGVKSVRRVGKSLGLDIHTTLDAIEYLVYAGYAKVIAPVTRQSCYTVTFPFLSEVASNPTNTVRLGFVVYMSARQLADGRGAYGKDDAAWQREHRAQMRAKAAAAASASAAAGGTKASSSETSTPSKPKWTAMKDGLVVDDGKEGGGGRKGGSTRKEKGSLISEEKGSTVSNSKGTMKARVGGADTAKEVATKAIEASSAAAGTSNALPTTSSTVSSPSATPARTAVISPRTTTTASAAGGGAPASIVASTTTAVIHSHHHQHDHQMAQQVLLQEASATIRSEAYLLGEEQSVCPADEYTQAAALLRFIATFQYCSVEAVQQYMRESTPFADIYGGWCDRAAFAAVEFGVLMGWLEHVGWSAQEGGGSSWGGADGGGGDEGHTRDDLHLHTHTHELEEDHHHQYEAHPHGHDPHQGGLPRHSPFHHSATGAAVEVGSKSDASGGGGRGGGPSTAIAGQLTASATATSTAAAMAAAVARKQRKVRGQSLLAGGGAPSAGQPAEEEGGITHVDT